MNILFINLIDNNKVHSISETTQSFKKNLKGKDTEYTIEWDDPEYKQNYYQLLESISKKKTKDCDYVCLLPEGSTLSDNYREIISEYVNENSTDIYLPLGLVISKESKRGVFNTILWSNQCSEPGILDHDLALRQTDTVLFGALIPKELFFDETYYNKDLKFYQHYQLLNQWSSLDSIKIIGIPKLLINLNYDLSFSSFSKEEKLEQYKLASKDLVSEVNV